MVSFMPPECLRAEGAKYDESLDVFSLGVLFLEIGTQQTPAPNIEGIGTIHEVKRRKKDLRRLNLLHPLEQFILLCLSDNPKQRPKAAELEMALSRLDVVRDACGAYELGTSAIDNIAVIVIRINTAVRSFYILTPCQTYVFIK